MVFNFEVLAKNVIFFFQNERNQEQQIKET